MTTNNGVTAQQWKVVAIRLMKELDEAYSNLVEAYKSGSVSKLDEGREHYFKIINDLCLLFENPGNVINPQPERMSKFIKENSAKIGESLLIYQEFLKFSLPRKKLEEREQKKSEQERGEPQPEMKIGFEMFELLTSVRAAKAPRMFQIIKEQNITTFARAPILDPILEDLTKIRVQHKRVTALTGIKPEQIVKTAPVFKPK
ncbi:MAG: hypothetical protein ACHQJ6_08870 [Candidatus Berkiellales bacterium]